MKKTVLLLLLFFTSACANPNYASAESSKVGNEKQGALDYPSILTSYNIDFDLSWVTNPQNQSENAFNLKFWQNGIGSKNGPLMDPPKTLVVYLWMPDMGHGSSPVTIEKKSDGLFEVSKIYFIMPGDWEIRLQIKEGKNILAQTIIPIHINK